MLVFIEFKINNYSFFNNQIQKKIRKQTVKKNLLCLNLIV